MTTTEPDDALPDVATRTGPEEPPAASRDREGVTIAVGFPAGAPGPGQLGEAAVSIGNGGAHPIFIREVEIRGQLPDPVLWLGSRDGELRVRTSHIEWRPRGSDVTEPIFAAGLLFPGESIEVPRMLRARARWIDVILRYSEIPGPKLASAVFLPRLDVRGSSSLVAMTFREPQLSDILRFRRLAPGDPDRVALIASPAAWTVESRELRIALPWDESAVTDDLSTALGPQGGEATRWESGGGWIVREPATAALLFHPDVPADRHPGTGDGLDPIAIPAALPVTAFDLADIHARAGEDVGLEIARGELVYADACAPERLLEVLGRAAKDGARIEIGIEEPLGPRRSAVISIRGPEIEAEADAAADADAEAGAEAEADAAAEADAEAGAEADAEADADAGAEAGAEADAEAGIRSAGE